jgi:hypothetical protein
VKLLLYFEINIINKTYTNYRTPLNFPNDQFSDTSTNDEIGSYNMKEFNSIIEKNS